MMKLTVRPSIYSALALALTFGVAPGVFGAATDASTAPPAFSSQDTDVPGAPVVDPGAPAAPVIHPEANTLPATSAQGQGGGPDSGAGNGLAAPTISDEQQIRNSMDMADELYHAEDYDSCARATSSILERYPKKRLYWVSFLNGLALEHQDMFTPAIASYELVRKEAPHTTYSNAASFRIGLCQLKLGESTEAIFTLRDIIENNPRSEYRLQAYMHLGNLYRTTHNWKEAQHIYRDIIRLYPNTSWAWTGMFYLAETHAHEGNIDLAIRVYDSLVRDLRVPETMRAQARLRIGDLFIVDGRWLEALQTYRMALRDFSKVPGVEMTANEKIQIATEGRKYNRVAYRQVQTGPHALEAPEDEDYRMKQEQEKIPYQ